MWKTYVYDPMQTLLHIFVFVGAEKKCHASQCLETTDVVECLENLRGFLGFPGLVKY